ncbi:MAG: copper homeostasis protein CutC [Bacteroidetes bacterium]|nr:MAG: copper homeostasis protein CutC [Bacteroidota bacterium]
MEKEKTLLEVAVFTPGSAIIAAKAGANRIELCSGYSEGGLSPSTGAIQYVREKLQIPVHVMIRPRIGDFIYDAIEKEIILKDIAFCKNSGIDGIVTGVLNPSGKIDKEFMQKVVETAGEMSVTFHRAFDITSELQESLETLIECGVSRVLTSGGKASVPDGLDAIISLVSQASDKIIILPGGGITTGNVKNIIQRSGVREIHFSGKELVTSYMEPKDGVSLTSHGEVNDYEWYECDSEKIEALKAKLNS